LNLEPIKNESDDKTLKKRVYNSYLTTEVIDTGSGIDNVR